MLKYVKIIRLYLHVTKYNMSRISVFTEEKLRCEKWLVPVAQLVLAFTQSA